MELAADRTWHVYKIRRKGVHLGWVKAATEKEGVEMAAKEYQIPDYVIFTSWRHKSGRGAVSALSTISPEGADDGIAIGPAAVSDRRFRWPHLIAAANEKSARGQRLADSRRAWNALRDRFHLVCAGA
jgi:hypothetical protein